MKEEMISYYDLLTMIKDIDEPNKYPKVYWHNNYREKVLYIPTFDIVSEELEGYHLSNRNLENEDIRYWLSECMLESSMFDKCLEIIEENNKIEKLDIHQEKNCKNNLKWQCNGYNISTPQKIIGEKINELIDFINNMKGE